MTSLKSRTMGTFLVVILLALASSCRSRQAPYKGYDLILLNIETLRSDFVSAYGSDMGCTPNMDSLAERGILAENSYTVAPWTRPSVGSLWTGLYPIRHGASRNIAEDSRLSQSAMTLAELLRQNNYTTFGYVTNANLSPDLGFDQGFEYYEYTPVARASQANAVVLEWIEQLSQSSERLPAFIAVHYHEPHAALDETSFADAAHDQSRSKMLEVAAGLNAGQRIAAIEGYCDTIRSVDREIGKLAQELEDRLGSRFLLVVTADHGEEWFDHGGLFHGFTLYNELLRVPLIFYSPGMEPARRQGAIANIDVLPTLSEWLGIEPPSSIDGQSMGDALLGSGEFRDEVRASTSFTKSLESIEVGDFKLVREPSSGRTLLFDFREDPREWQNRMEEDAEIARQLASRLEDIYLDLSAKTTTPGLESRTTWDKTQRLIRDLKSLGYLGNSAEPEDDSWPRGHRVFWRDLYKNYSFVRLDDPSIRHDPSAWSKTPDGKYFVARGDSGASIQLHLAGRENFLVFGSNSESGIVQLRVNGKHWKEIDLYSDDRLDLFPVNRAPRQLVVPIEHGHMIKELEIVLTGRHTGSARTAHVYFKGVVLSKGEG
jgi:arylsulfatase A-like enzyme